MKKKILIGLVLVSITMSSLFIIKLTKEEEKQVQVIDVRPQLIDNYYKERGMPLEGYGKKMVEVADKYGLDWRLLPAISIRESSGGLHMCKNNPFGWGSCKITFNSLDEAIETVSYKLANLPVYKDKTTERKLYYYNGTVLPTYPAEVISIMNKFGN